MAEKWDASKIPDQSGRTALITGANSGIGFQAALELARAGATVLLGCRDPERGGEALGRIAAEVPGAKIELIELDLADLASIRGAAEQVVGRPDPLDLLINNAGVMAAPKRQTADGFELQLGTNHLGHFALDGLLIGKVLSAPAARVVTVSSNAHKTGTMDFDDLMSEESYSSWLQYGRSKLANLMFALELDRRLRKDGARAISVAVHPGYSATNLQFAGPGMARFGFLQEAVMWVGNVVVAQSDERGALPTLYAATSAEVSGGDYIGPDGFGELRGHPTKVEPAGRAKKQDDWRRLWKLSEKLTGVRYEALA